MRITCREMAAGASAHLDGDQTRLERFKAQAHLLACRDCRAHLDQLRRTVSLVSRAGRGPTGAEDRLVAVMLAERRRVGGGP